MGITVFGLLFFAFAIAVGVVIVMFVLVPILKGIGWCIGGIFRCIGFMIAHIFSFIGGMISDTIRFIGAVLAMLVLAPLAPLNVVIGRWSAAGHFATSVKREVKVAGLCMYRVLLQRPLKLVFLHGLLEGLEQRVPEAVAASPTGDHPSKRTGQFAGYTIVGSLRGGGSGGKLYIAAPDDAMRRQRPDLPDRLVIKSFALTEGSSLPQIVRESRALECARQLGLVVDHSLDQHRFWYAMPYHPGEHLGIITRQMHAESSENGLGRKQLAEVMAYTRDLLATLACYHQGGLWHKDVKPENVIIHDGRAQLVDLGLVTSLRSAMTLTTHGTEYFRDPELVRQALRGVRVHQIDCSKFDIYAVGAVLYFMVENTFPAHGGLSRFSHESPEALKWIIRRAMAEYHHRYERVEQVLADLRVVMSASDPYAVKPAQLPSMTGAYIAEDTAQVAPQDDVILGVMGAHTPHAVQAARVAHEGEAHGGDAAQPPHLRVVNWWTGAYEVIANDARPHPHAPAEPIPGAGFGHARRTALHHARRTARQQVKSARERAHAMQRKARQRRTRAVAERQPSAFLIGVSVVVLLAFAGVGALVLMLTQRSANDGPPVMAAAVAQFEERPLLLLVNDHPRRNLRTIRNAVEDLVRSYEQRGYQVMDDRAAAREIAPLLAAWQDDPSDENDFLLEDALESHGYYGVLQAASSEGSGAGFEHGFVRSTRDDADRRTLAWLNADSIFAPTAEADTLLLVNDHPEKARADVAAKINAVVVGYRNVGWTVTTNDELEARLRVDLPVGPFMDSSALRAEVFTRLEMSDVDGVLWITSPLDRPDAVQPALLLQAGNRLLIAPFEGKDPVGGIATARGFFSDASSRAARTVTVDTDPHGQRVILWDDENMASVIDDPDAR